MDKMILGFDPGRDKCGVAVMAEKNRITSIETTSDADNGATIAFADVVAADEAIATVLSLLQTYPISTMVMGDQTMAKQWKAKFERCFTEQCQDSSPPPPQAMRSAEYPIDHRDTPLPPRAPIPIVFVDERYSSLEARDRYWQLHPPKGLTRLVPQSLRSIARPIDDVVAIILIERYWQTR